MIDPVIVWLKITQYNNKREISLLKLVGTLWIYRYPKPTYITYGQGSEFIGHEFKNT